MNCGMSLGWAASVFGKSSLRLEVISGAVIMKMTSSTSMTSMSGVMLMSLIGWAPGVRSRRPKAIAVLLGGPRRARPGVIGSVVARDHLAQVVGEALELGLARRDALAEHVVGEHRGDRDGEPGRRHHQRFAHRPRDALDRDRAGRRDAEERVIDPPNRAE